MKNAPVTFPCWWALLLAAALLAGPPAARAHDDHEALPASGVAVRGDWILLSPEAEQALGIETAKVELTDLEETVVVPGAIEVPCHQHAVASSLVAGRIVTVLVRPGQRVAAGQELARIESLELEGLQTQLLTASAALELAEKQLAERQRAREALPGKLLLQSQAERARRAAELGVAWQKLLALGASAEQLAEVRRTGRLIDTLPVRAPLAGAVAHAVAREGQIVEPAEPLFSILEPDHVWVVGQLLEAHAVKVQAGAPVEAQFGEESIAGRVEGLGVRLDPRQRTLPVWFTVANDAGKLRPGMFGQVRAPIARVAQAVVCPQAALKREGNGWFALIREAPGKFLRRRVEVGLRTAGRAEVLDGLFPGDPVVTTGLQELAALFGGERPSATAEEAGPPLEELVSRPAGTQVRSALAEVELPADRKRFVSPALGGRLASLLVERGQFVQAGQLVGEVESLELAGLVLEELEAQTELGMARAMTEKLAAPGVQTALPGQERWQLEARVESATAVAEALRAKLRLAGLSEEDLTALERLDPADMVGAKDLVPRLPLKAPADGWLADFELSIGQSVAPDDRLFEIHDHSQLWVRADLFQDDAARVKAGDEARVFFAADPTLQVVGRVARVGPQLDERGRTGSVWIEIDNPGGRLREGMLARALIFVAQGPAELAEKPAVGSRP